VFFSGLTVAIGMASLMLTRLSFMVSMGLGGVVVPVTALMVAMTLLPAMLGILGDKLNIRVFRAILRKVGVGDATIDRLPRLSLTAGDSGMWHRLATAIMRRPLISGGAALAVMLALTFPLTQLTLSYGGLKNAPKDLESVSGFLYMRNHFTSTPDPTQIVIQRSASGTVLQPASIDGIRALENLIRRNHEVTKVVGPADFVNASGARRSDFKQAVGRYLSPDLRTALIEVVPRHEVGTKSNESMVRKIRVQVAAAQRGALAGNVVHVGGASAGYIDFNDALYNKFPTVILFVLILTYVFLFFAFRSVFLPLKAVVLNLLSVGAAYGMLQLVFQRGVGATPLGFIPEDGVAPWVPIFLFAFLFGLSMDYEVFLLSRIREHWLRTGNNRASVAFGLEKTGRLITSAASIMVVAFSGFLIGHEIQLKQFGFGLLASIAVDATIVRVVLVPSIMEVIGPWNWWVPSFLGNFATGGSLEGDEPLVVDEEREPVTA
jgi:RND superfamily putative drug exporter